MTITTLLSSTSINTDEESQAPSRISPSPFTDNQFKQSPNAARVSDRMFPVTLKRGWMAPTVSGVLSCRLPSLSCFSLMYTLWHPQKKSIISDLGFVCIFQKRGSQAGAFPMRGWQRRAHLCTWQRWSGAGWMLRGRVLMALQLSADTQLCQAFCFKRIKKDVLLPLTQIQKVLIDIPRS